MKKRTKIILTSIAVILCLTIPGISSRLKVVRYVLKAEGIGRPIRIALVTDLHSCAYGDGQQALLDAIGEQAPDVVLLGGDIFDSRLPDGNSMTFLKEIGGRYPCYYVIGNHECRGDEVLFEKRMQALEEYGIVRLSGEIAELETGGAKICICGVDDPDNWTGWRGRLMHAESSFREQLANLAAQPKDGAYTVLLTHRPEMLELYSRYGFDLALAGHAHGGQWRIPGILNGLFAPDQGLFPRYAGGLYEKNGTTMIVSRGLAKESTQVPRIYNRPELVIIDLTNNET